MRADGEKMPASTGSRSAAQLAGAHHHGRTAAAMAAATPLEEELPVQRSAAAAPLASAHSRDLAQLQAIVNRRPRAAADEP